MAESVQEQCNWVQGQGKSQPQLSTQGYVGIDTLQEQIRRRVLRRGFQFNLIVVGRSGLGKSTLVNTLFKSEVSLRNRTCPVVVAPPSDHSKPEGNSKDREAVSPPMPPPRTTHIRSVTHVIEEKGVKLRLTVTDTPGFGDQVNNDKCWVPVVEYIREQFDKYLQEEQNVRRKRAIPDSRVHCCLYFIPPTGHSLRPLDIEVMRRLDKVVNVVPVIAKADTLTLEERKAFKQRLRQDLLNNAIRIYPCKDFEDPDDVAVNDAIRALEPFAVVGSAGLFEDPSTGTANGTGTGTGRSVLGRLNRWGLVEVENRAHCEFADLRSMIIRTHMHDLVEVTSSVHYEAFRRRRLRNRTTELSSSSRMDNGHSGDFPQRNDDDEDVDVDVDNIDGLNESSL